MPKKFYAVAVGRSVGIFTDWESCKKQVMKFGGAKYKGFDTKEEAQDYIDKNSKRSAGSEPPAVRTTAIKRQKTTPPKKKLKISMSFDGGSRGNPGIAGAGAEVISSDVTGRIAQDRKKVHIRTFVGTKATNNEAEYDGMISGLEQVLKETRNFLKTNNLSPEELGVSVVVQGDSDLIIKQMNGIYGCNSENLQSRYQRSKKLTREISGAAACTIVFEHVYRADNTVADGLANQAMDAQRSWTSTFDDDAEDLDSLM